MANVYQQLLHVTGDLLYPGLYRVLAQGAVYSLEVQEVEVLNNGYQSRQS